MTMNLSVSRPSMWLNVVLKSTTSKSTFSVRKLLTMVKEMDKVTYLIGSAEDPQTSLKELPTQLD